MRTALEQARDRGVDLFFTGANEVYWKVRYEPSPVSGRQDRVLVCYKSTQSGGPDPSGIPTGTWRDPAGANQPENGLSGGMYIGQKDFTYFPLKVSAAQGKERTWRYTGLDTQATGTSTTFGTGLTGWEWDARVANGARAARRDRARRARPRPATSSRTPAGPTRPAPPTPRCSSTRRRAARS